MSQKLTIDKEDIVTPQEMLRQFQEELGALQKRYNVVIVPFIKQYNNGESRAEIEFRIANGRL